MRPPKKRVERYRYYWCYPINMPYCKTEYFEARHSQYSNTAKRTKNVYKCNPDTYSQQKTATWKLFYSAIESE